MTMSGRAHTPLSLAALAALLLQTPAIAAVGRYTVLTGSRAVGTLVADGNPGAGGETVKIAYDHEDNGHGPTMAETLTPSAAGLPVNWKVTAMGIGLEPDMLVLDGGQRMVAFATPEFVVVREGPQGKEARLRALVALEQQAACKSADRAGEEACGGSRDRECADLRP